MAPSCPNYDSEDVDPSQFFDGHSITWKRHYIGWGIAGALAFIATAISFRLLFKHARNYNKPSEQRHIMRIVLMIPIYSVISFLSYRFYREAIYYETVRDCYEAFVIHSFFVLLLTYLGEDNESRKARLPGKSRKLVFPLNCWYYNPVSDMFLHYCKYGILQYVVIKPITTIAAVVLQYKDLYCETLYSFSFGRIYLTIINFASVTVAMYALVLMYVTIKDEIQDKKPFLKFLCIKLIIFIVFYQTVLLSILGHFEVFEATTYWSVLNIELGISALLVCFEMVIFAILHVYSFSYTPYINPDAKTPVSKSLRDAFNPIDLFREIGWAAQDITRLITGRPLPTRDGHLSGALKRADTVRARRSIRGRKGSSPNSSDPAMTMVNPSTMEAGGKHEVHELEENPQQAPLLGDMDAQQQQLHHQQQQEQQLQQQQQQEQQQQYQLQMQQQQQQQLYTSRPADGYQY
ncbi:unnamed protein product [Mortierella alpina]